MTEPAPGPLDAEPVEIVDYDPAWPIAFEAIAEEIHALGLVGLTGIQHIGSTSVPGLAGKRVIDVALECESLATVNESWVGPITGLGFEYYRPAEAFLPLRRLFRRGATGALPRCHLHAEVPGTEPHVHHVVFRDALRADDAIREEYARVKRVAAEASRDDRHRYTELKDGFVRGVIERTLRGA